MHAAVWMHATGTLAGIMRAAAYGRAQLRGGGCHIYIVQVRSMCNVGGASLRLFHVAIPQSPCL